MTSTSNAIMLAYHRCTHVTLSRVLVDCVS